MEMGRRAEIADAEVGPVWSLRMPTEARRPLGYDGRAEGMVALRMVPVSDSVMNSVLPSGP